ncbi:MFS transporter [Spirillospora sp. CA-294931]|uniref:MFS transporter n=1 Tax=Spirillospora sp. CA-294931 TaxID=3240042 RepID=UPI003D9046E7
MSHPLRDRGFRLLFTARALSLTGDAAVPAALALAVLRVTGSASSLALVLACAMVPRLVLLPLGGVLADRFSARKVALITDLVSCGAQLFAGVELLSGDPRLWHLAVAQVISGAASGLGTPTISPLVSGIVRPAGRQRANAALATANGATRLLGPAIAGTFVLTIGPGWTFILDAASFGVSAALMALVRFDHVPGPRHSLRADLVEGWSEVRSRDWYWSSLIAHAIWNGAAGVMLTLGPVIAVRELGGEATWVAVLQAGAVGLVVGALLASRIRPRRPILVANLGLAAYALPLTLLAFEAPAPLIIASYGLALTGLGVLNPTWETVVQSTVPPQALARVTSYDWLLSLAAAPIAYALAPPAAEAWGPAVPLLIAAALVATSCLATAAVPSVRHLSLPPPPTNPAPPTQDQKPPTPASHPN